MSRQPIPSGSRVYPYLLPGTGIILEAVEHPIGYRAVNICRVGGSEFITVGPTELQIIADRVTVHGVPRVPDGLRPRWSSQGVSKLPCGCAMDNGLFVPCAAHLEIGR